MMCRFNTLLIFLFFVANTKSNDTICLSNLNGEQSIIKDISFYEDETGKLQIKEILDNPGKYAFNRIQKNMNFGFSQSNIWFKLSLKHCEPGFKSYFLELRNPDMAKIHFFECDSSQITDSLVTGELYNTSTRHIYHRYFVLKVDFNGMQTKDFYIMANNQGRLIYTPFYVSTEKSFHTKDFSYNSLNWLVLGIIFFISFFNLYMHRANRSKLNLYNSAYIFTGFLFIFYFDGYHFITNLPRFNRDFKFFPIFAFSFFILLFAKEFVHKTKYRNSFKKIITPMLWVICILPVFIFFPYPVKNIGDQGLRIMAGISILVVVVLSMVSVKRDSLPTLLVLLAHLILLFAFIIIQLKEFKLMEYNLFTESSIKVGLAFQAVFLTIAVLEQFRIEQLRAQNTIKTNLAHIDLQNKELEFINLELEKLSIVASETKNGVAICNPNGRIDWCNASFEKFYDITYNELLVNKTDRIDKVIPNSSLNYLFKQCIEHKKPKTFETLVETKRNKSIWVQTTLTPYINGNKVNKIISIDADITALKRYEARLQTAKNKAEESDKLKTAFLGNMSHEIRTPLNGIVGFSELLQLNNIKDEKRQKYTKMIKSNSEQLLFIMDDLLDISLIESGQLRVDSVECRLGEIVQEGVDFFNEYKYNIDKGHIALHYQRNVETGMDTLDTDPARLRQVLTNLLKNALKFTETGIAKVVLSDTEETLEVSVEDTGIGVNPGKKDIIFKRFRQGEETLSRKYGGTGIGLSICKGIMDKLKGDIWLDTSYTNGARFVVSLPKKNELQE